MNNINNILVAVELDKESEAVIEYAITLGLMLGANVRYLHISRPIAYRIEYDESGDVINYSPALEGSETDNLEDRIRSDEENLKAKVLLVIKRMAVENHLVETKVRSDFAVSGILTEAEEVHTDLIIIGAHVDYRKKDMGISSLSKSIIDKAEQGVVVVPSTYGNRNLDHMCMFVNFEFEELTMIQNMIEVATKNDIHLSFVHILDAEVRVVDVDEKMKVYRRLFLKDKEHDLISFVLKSGKLASIIDDLTNNMGVDFIGLKSQRRHWNLFGFQKTFDKSMLNQIKVPLYVWKR